MKKKIMIVTMIVCLLFTNTVNADTTTTSPFNFEIVEKVATTIALMVAANFSDVTHYDDYAQVIRDEFPNYWNSAGTGIKGGIDLFSSAMTEVRGDTLDFIVDVVSKILLMTDQSLQGTNTLSLKSSSLQIRLTKYGGSLYFVRNDGSITSNRNELRIDFRNGLLIVDLVRSAATDIKVYEYEYEEGKALDIYNYLKSYFSNMSMSDALLRLDNLTFHPYVTSMTKYGEIYLGNPGTWDESFNDYLNGLSISEQPYVPGQGMSLNIPRSPGNTYTGRTREGATDLPSGTLVEYDPTVDRVFNRETGEDVTDLITGVGAGAGAGTIDWDIPSVNSGDVPYSGTITNPYTGEVTDISTGTVIRTDTPTIPYDPAIPANPDIPVNPPITVPDVPITNGGINFQPLVMNFESLTRKFPFSIPWDLTNQLAIFNVQPETPVFSIDEPNFFEFGNVTIPFQMELNFEKFDALAAAIRWLLTISFDVALILLIRKLLPE